ncbi:hypothetical protein FACS1894103_2000 [Campylobacterota bacterium]|nr:hypothetical protein FACS1894103_2000 [Campylobacterota bacterium]
MPKLRLFFANKFKKGLARCIKRGYDRTLLDTVIALLQNGEKLPAKYKDHALKGNKDGLRDCHIKPDWVLIYKIKNDELVLVLLETGTHSDLFGS